MECVLLQMLKAEEIGDSAKINLKSCVPIFMAYPELTALSGKCLSDIAPYYKSNVDYTDTHNVVDIGVSEITLLSVFNGVLSELMNRVLSAGGKELPRLSVVVDIGNDSTVYSEIKPLKDLSEVHKSGYFYEGLGLKFNLVACKSDAISENMRHNIMLLRELRTRCNSF